jgi:hypothetical protein
MTAGGAARRELTITARFGAHATDPYGVRDEKTLAPEVRR